MARDFREFNSADFRVFALRGNNFSRILSSDFTPGNEFSRVLGKLLSGEIGVRRAQKQIVMWDTVPLRERAMKIFTYF